MGLGPPMVDVAPLKSTSTDCLERRFKFALDRLHSVIVESLGRGDRFVKLNLLIPCGQGFRAIPNQILRMQFPG